MSGTRCPWCPLKVQEIKKHVLCPPPNLTHLYNLLKRGHMGMFSGFPPGKCAGTASAETCVTPNMNSASWQLNAHIMELYSSGWTASLPFSTAAATQPLLWAPNRLFHNPQLPFPTTLQEQLKMQLPILGQSFHRDPSDLQFGRK